MSSTVQFGSRRLAINADWFGRLRWVAAVGQLATIAFVTGPLGVVTPVGPLLLLVGVTLLSNAAFWWWTTTRISPPDASTWHAVVGGLMLLDLLVLTAMLALTGGPTNPFVMFYFVNLALSGVVLPASWAWALSALAIVGFALLSIGHAPIEVLRDPDRLVSLTALRASGEDAIPPALFGAWIAFAASAVVIVNFTTRLTRELRDSERARRHAESEHARGEKLEALGTLAAGAAHELATPLSTIALTVSEAYRELQQAGVESPALQDLTLARREVDRCRTILDRMATDSGQPAAGVPEEITAEDLIEDVLADLPGRGRVDTEFLGEAAGLVVLAPPTAIAQALRAVVQNGLDATDEVDATGRVKIRADRLADALRIRVVDGGPGMPAEVLSRASEPFFTTKDPGRGMGLGLFLARSVIEKIGGSLRLESPSTGGAAAIIVLPLAAEE